MELFLPKEYFYRVYTFSCYCFYTIGTNTLKHQDSFFNLQIPNIMRDIDNTKKLFYIRFIFLPMVCDDL